MDYKSVLEEQIRELQKLQDEAIKCTCSDQIDKSCKIAETIINLVREANQN